jgi:AraC-like DNA-binding protein
MIMKIQYLSSTSAPDRHHSWEQLVDELFGAVDMSIANAATFNGEIRRASLGELELDEVASDFEIAKRTRSHIARDRKECFVLILLRSGELHVEQNGRQCSLSPGMFALFDLNMPYVYAHIQKTELLDVKIPSSILSSVVKDPHRFIAKARTGRTGTGRITADFLTSLAGQLSDLPDETAGRYASRIIDLLSILLETGDDDIPIDQVAVRTTIYGRCVVFVENHLADPDLNPERIAAALGISVRYLHKIFHRSGESVCDFIRRVRLKRSYGELMDASKKGLLVKEIAFRGGFRSQAHFASMIKKSYGASPTDLRQFALERQQRNN